MTLRTLVRQTDRTDASVDACRDISASPTHVYAEKAYAHAAVRVPT